VGIRHRNGRYRKKGAVMAEEDRVRGAHPSDPAEGSRQAGERAEAKAARRNQDETGKDSGESAGKSEDD
jgi:hypothetical protein